MHVIMTICLLTRSLCASPPWQRQSAWHLPRGYANRSPGPADTLPAEDPANLAAPACATRAVLPARRLSPWPGHGAAWIRPPPAQPFPAPVCLQ